MHPSGKWATAILTAVDGGVRRNMLRAWAVDGSSECDLLANPEPAAGYELSGGVHAWNSSGDRCVIIARRGLPVVVTFDVALQVTGIVEVPVPEAKSWSSATWSPDGETFGIVANWRELWLCDANGVDARCIYDHSDFVFDVTWWQNEPAFMAWNRPHMPWTHADIVDARRRTVASSEGASHQQPRASADGRLLGMVSDTGGYSNVRVVDGSGQTVFTMDEQLEHAPSTWGPGSRTWAFNFSGSHIAFARNEDGFGSLNVVSLSGGDVVRLGNGVHGCVSWVGDTIVALRSGARTPQQMVLYDMSGVSDHSQKSDALAPKRSVLCDPDGGRWRADDILPWLVEPTVHDCAGEDVAIPFRLYKSPDSRGVLICWIHGGPNDQWQVTFRPRLTYWLSRGCDIAVVDHRGTTGHGREFVDALNGGWGVRDADDGLAVLDHLWSVDNYSPSRTVLMGGSAGGLTVLSMLARRRGAAAAAIVSYPVVDLFALAHGDDPFETHYVPTLVGADSADDTMLHERSPLNNASSIALVPLLVFHGSDDTVVPLTQSLVLHDAVETAGGVIRLEVMSGEGHGFSSPEAIDHEYAVTSEFLAECGLNLATEPEPR